VSLGVARSVQPRTLSCPAQSYRKYENDDAERRQQQREGQTDRPRPRTRSSLPLLVDLARSPAHSLPDRCGVMSRMPSSLSLTSLSTLVCGRQVCAHVGEAGSQQPSRWGRGRRQCRSAATHLVRLSERGELVAKQLAHLAVLDDAAHGPREQVRVAAVARVPRDRQRRAGEAHVERGRRLNERGRLEVVLHGEAAGESESARVSDLIRR